MTYGPAAVEGDPRFDNVFVNRSAYKSFLASGRWPDKTIFVLEIRKSQSEGSINKGGHFQTSTAAVEVHVKDEKRFKGSWAFFGFGEGKETAKQIPMSAIKSQIGHPQGASGAAGIAATLVAMQSGQIPPTINIETPDPDCDLDYVPQAGRKAVIDHAVCNCIAFGSKNSALVLSRVA